MHAGYNTNISHGHTHTLSPEHFCSSPKSQNNVQTGDGIATVKQWYILFSSRIDANRIIKVADFGLSESMYTRNYYKQNIEDEGAKLPMKWMAIECLHDGVFNEKTDVVSCIQPSCDWTCY